MAENSKIGWTDHTHNFWWGCHKVSKECQFCYISGIMKRGGYEPFAGPIRTKNWDKPTRWNKLAHREKVRLRIFTCSMSDFFHEGADEWRDEAWDVIRNCPQLDWLVLTKRPDRIEQHLPKDWGQGYPNVWLGVTAGCADSFWRLDALQALDAHVKFLSAEPLLESLDLSGYLPSLDWVITGCEQAKKGSRRLMELDWVREIDRQCRLANVPHFFKQYYHDDGGIPRVDGVLDGRVRQAWPNAA